MFLSRLGFCYSLGWSQQPAVGRGIIQPEDRAVRCQVQAQDLAGEPSRHRLDRYVLPPAQAVAFKRRNKVFPVRIEQKVLGDFELITVKNELVFLVFLARRLGSQFDNGVKTFALFPDAIRFAGLILGDAPHDKHIRCHMLVAVAAHVIHEHVPRYVDLRFAGEPGAEHGDLIGQVLAVKGGFGHR